MVARSEAEARDIFGKSGPLIATPNTELMAVDMPKIDFATEMVVAVFSGQVRAGTSLRIANIITNEDGVQVFYVITPPDPQAIGVDVMISPYAIAIIPANKAEYFLPNKPAKLLNVQINNIHIND